MLSFTELKFARYSALHESGAKATGNQIGSGTDALSHSRRLPRQATKRGLDFGGLAPVLRLDVSCRVDGSSPGGVARSAFSRARAKACRHRQSPSIDRLRCRTAGRRTAIGSGQLVRAIDCTDNSHDGSKSARDVETHVDRPLTSSCSRRSSQRFTGSGSGAMSQCTII